MSRHYSHSRLLISNVSWFVRRELGSRHRFCVAPLSFILIYSRVVSSSLVALSHSAQSLQITTHRIRRQTLLSVFVRPPPLFMRSFPLDDLRCYLQDAIFIMLFSLSQHCRVVAMFFFHLELHFSVSRTTSTCTAGRVGSIESMT